MLGIILIALFIGTLVYYNKDNPQAWQWPIITHEQKNKNLNTLMKIFGIFLILFSIPILGSGIFINPDIAIMICACLSVIVIPILMIMFGFFLGYIFYLILTLFT